MDSHRRAESRPEGDRAPVTVAERSEGTAASGRRDLDGGRARPMTDRNQRAEETVENPDLVDYIFDHSPVERGTSVDYVLHGRLTSIALVRRRAPGEPVPGLWKSA
jgi:hypothetical protein